MSRSLLRQISTAANSENNIDVATVNETNVGTSIVVPAVANKRIRVHWIHVGVVVGGTAAIVTLKDASKSVFLFPFPANTSDSRSPCPAKPWVLGAGLDLQVTRSGTLTTCRVSVGFDLV